MRRSALFVAALSLGAALPAAARAQIIIGASGGAAFPVGNFANSISTGYQGTVSLALGLPAIPIGFRGEGSYARFSSNRTGGGVTSPSLRIISGTGNIIYGLAAPIAVTPYLIGGVGAYNTNCTDDGCIGKTQIGFNGGIGVKLGLAGLSVFAEARAHHVNSSAGYASATYVPVTVGVTF